MTGSARRGAGDDGRRRPRAITAEYLERAALHYLERFAATAEGLRRVLTRKVRRAALAAADQGVPGPDMERASGWIEALVARLVASGMVNDAAFAEMKTAGLRRKGGSARIIRRKLAEKGVGTEDVARALAAEDGEDAAAADLAAAQAFARRRRLGPYRTQRGEALAEDEARKQHRRDLASLARAGFDIATASRALALTTDDLEGDGY